jgi:hypothetical protein
VNRRELRMSDGPETKIALLPSAGTKGPTWHRYAYSRVGDWIGPVGEHSTAVVHYYECMQTGVVRTWGSDEPPWQVTSRGN